MTQSATAPWWQTTEPGAPVELGFVRIDRVGSTQDWHGLSSEQVIARRTEFHQIVETNAAGFGAMSPILWQGDGAMLFLGASADGQTTAAVQAFQLATMLQQQLALSGFTVRLGAHCGRVAFERDAGKLASPEVDRAGHLEHDCPPGAVALSEDVYLSLPQEQREKCAYLGATRRDATVAFVYPKSMAVRRDAALFAPPASSIRSRAPTFVASVTS